MRQADIIVATGGEAMVKAAYSSGTPAYGVGVGNSVHVVDETGDIEDAAKKHDTEIEFTRTAQAEEFRKSLSIRAEQSKTVESASPALQVDDAKATFEKRRARWGESSITSSDTNKKADTERPHVDG